MSKGYVKDPNGKYRLVDKDRDQGIETTSNSKPLTIEERLARLEAVIFMTKTT